MMDIRIISAGFILICTSFSANSQNVPVYRQYYLNPSLLNPAYNGINNYNEANLFYRQQWMGVEDAPRSFGFNFQYPTKKNVFMALDFFSEEVVAVNTSSLAVSVGYSLPIAINHDLRFAITGGIGLNRLDLNEQELNSNDNVLLLAMNNNMFINGRFGVVYQYKKFNIGFSLPRLFESSAFSDKEFNDVNFSEVDHLILNTSYSFDLSHVIALQPHIVYFRYPAISEIGGAVSLNYQEKLWVGVNYQNSIGGFVGLQFSNIRAQYNYENAAFSADALDNSSHGVQLSFRLGQNKKKNKLLISEETEDLQIKMNDQEVSEKEISTTIEVQKENITDQDQKQVQNINQNKQLKDKEDSNFDNKPQQISASDSIEVPTPQLIKIDEDENDIYSQPIDIDAPNFDNGFKTKIAGLAKGYYVVAGVFAVAENAMKFSQQLNINSYKSDIVYDKWKALYYVFVYYDQENKPMASEVRKKFHQKKGFEDVWLMQVK